MKHLLPELPYAPNALEPRMSGNTIAYHYGKHLQTYLNNVNQMVEGTPYEDMPLKEIICTAEGPLFNNAAQAWNHILFFKQLSPKPVMMSSALTQKISACFGNVEDFRAKFCQAAISLFGSGWVWLAIDSQQELKIVSSPNAGNPMTQNMRPLLCIDVWEHAYYLDYQNKRADYVENFWHLIDWDKVESRIQPEDPMLFY